MGRYVGTSLPLLVVLLGAWAPEASAEVTSFNNEAEFVRVTGAKGPHRPPSSAVTRSITVADRLLVITPGQGANNVACGNVIGQRAQLSVGNDRSFSHLDVQLGGKATAFGFVVASHTADGFAGISEFRVTLLDGGREVGTVSFEAPAKGEIFFGLQSTVAFDKVTIREEKGGPQNATPTGGLADREWFGEFYTDAQKQAAIVHPAAPDGPGHPVAVDDPGWSGISLVLLVSSGVLAGLSVVLVLVIVVLVALRANQNPDAVPGRRRR